MAYMTPFEALQASAVPVDWMTILVGWQEEEIPDDAIRMYAVDKLGTGRDDDEEYRFLQLADADDRVEFARLLTRFADESGIDREHARRKWRFAVLKYLLPLLSPGPGSDEEWWTYEREAELEYFWKRFDALPDNPANHLLAKCQPNRAAYRRMLTRHQEWLGQEEDALRGDAAMMTGKG